MSYSSLWVMDKEYKGYPDVDFSNSWFFSPIVWDVILDKYLPHRKLVLIGGETAGFMSSVMSDNKLNSDLNKELNNSDTFSDRILWEMSNQQIFFTKDKKTVADAIRKFLTDNVEYEKSREDGISVLQREHIIERFNEIANSIEELDENEYPYFIFKNTSCDDNVEYWFSKRNEETDEYETASLKELDKYVSEFVVIDGNKINFIDNLEYFKSESEEI